MAADDDFVVNVRVKALEKAKLEVDRADPSAYTQYNVPASVETSFGTKRLRMPLDMALAVVVEYVGKMIDVEINQCDHVAAPPLIESQTSVPADAETEAASGVGVPAGVIDTVRVGFVVDDVANIMANRGALAVYVKAIAIPTH